MSTNKILQPRICWVLQAVVEVIGEVEEILAVVVTAEVAEEIGPEDLGREVGSGPIL